MKKRRLEDGGLRLGESFPKKSKIDPSYCKHGCGRATADGSTRHGNTYNTCCQPCALFYQNKPVKQDCERALKHDPECNRKFTQDYSFTLVAVKTRSSPYHRGADTSRKFIFTVNNRYYYRLWRGLNYNSYVLIHPLKFVTNEQTLTQYIDAFEYSRDEVQNYAEEFNGEIPAYSKKAKIIQSMHQLDAAPSFAEFMASRAKTDVHIHGDVVLAGVSFHNHVERGRNLMASYVSEELRTVFPFSDIESGASCILSNCSGETTWEVECQTHALLNEWLLRIGCNSIPDGHEIDEFDLAEISGLSEEFFWDLKTEIVHEHIHYKKLHRALDNEKTAAMLSKLHRKIEWNADKQQPYFEAILSGWKECNANVAHELLSLIEPVLTREILAQRRMQFWRSKCKEIKDGLGPEASAKIQEHTSDIT